MDSKKVSNSKTIRLLNQEIAPEPVLKAPPPTPCVCLKQRSGSVPDVRIVEVKRSKIFYTESYHRGVTHNPSYSCKPTPRAFLDVEGKRSTSEQGMTSGILRSGAWMVLGMGPCTSNLLHSVRQRLMNL